MAFRMKRKIEGTKEAEITLEQIQDVGDVVRVHPQRIHDATRCWVF